MATSEKDSKRRKKKNPQRPDHVKRKSDKQREARQAQLREQRERQEREQNREHEYESHAEPFKIYWGQLIPSLILLIVLAAVITSGVVMAFRRLEANKDAKTTKITASTTAQVMQTATAPSESFNPNLTKITPTSENIYLLEGKKKKVKLKFDADITKELDRIVWTSDDENVATVDTDGNVSGVKAGECEVHATYGNVTANVDITVRHLDKKDGITYVDGIMVANKEISLPESYDPEGILPDVQTAFDKLSSDASKEGLDIYIGSSYRSYSEQVAIFDNYVDMYGEDIANVFSSKPGHSEHQTGMTIDVNTIDSAFGHTKESDWLAKHAADYGFIIRYPEGKEKITGYEYEPWHIRYLGVDIAKDVKKTGLCLEEYLGIDDKTYTFPDNFDYENMQFKEN